MEATFWKYTASFSTRLIDKHETAVELGLSVTLWCYLWET